MGLNKVNYQDLVTVIAALNLNDIQDAIIALENAVPTLATKAEVDAVEALIGTLSSLETTDKTSIVNAINEVLGDIGAVEGDIEDISADVTDLKDDLSALGLSVVSGKLCVTYIS